MSERMRRPRSENVLLSATVKAVLGKRTAVTVSYKAVVVSWLSPENGLVLSGRWTQPFHIITFRFCSVLMCLANMDLSSMIGCQAADVDINHSKSPVYKDELEVPGGVKWKHQTRQLTKSTDQSINLSSLPINTLPLSIYP